MTEAITHVQTAAGDAGGETKSARFVVDPPIWRDELARYAASAVLAAVVGAVLIHTFDQGHESVEATETDHAVMVDLPAALSSSQPASEAQEGPQQEASEASPASPPDPRQERAPEIQPPKPLEPPVHVAEPKFDAPQAPIEDALPVEPPKPIEPPKPDEPPKAVEIRPPQKMPQPVAAPSPAVAEQAPRGSDTPLEGEHPESDEGRPHASSRAITAWQRSLVGRLEIAKRSMPHGVTRAAIGTVQVAFAIDRDGRVISEKVARSSGSSTLDATALSLVRRAAPFPTPPLGTGDRDLSFIVPINFRH